MPGLENTACRLPQAGERDMKILRIEALLSRADELDPGYRDTFWGQYMRSLNLTDFSVCDLGEIETVIEQDIHILLREVEG